MCNDVYHAEIRLEYCDKIIDDKHHFLTPISHKGHVAIIYTDIDTF